MAKPRNAYEVALPDGRKVVIAELKTGELEQALTLAGTGAASEFRVALEGLRLSVRQVAGRDTNYTQLQGELWDEAFSLRETMLLADAWRAVHMPSDNEVEAARGNVRAIAGSS